MFAFPIPVPEGAPIWLLNVVFVAGGAVVLVVLIWQAVRFFRTTRDED
ncbi:hypothetical protein [Pseudolysinimonas sp.]|jgi:hypothetical protein